MRGGHQTTSNNQLWRSVLLIDLHQLNVKTTSDNTNQRHWIRQHINEKRTRRQQPATSAFLDDWTNSTCLRAKESGNFSAWVIEACRQNGSKELLHQLKVMKNERRVLPSEQDDIVNSPAGEHCSNWVAVLPFLTVTDCVLALSQTK